MLGPFLCLYWPAHHVVLASCNVVSAVFNTPSVPDDAAGLRGANARLRELVAERDAEIAEL